MYTILLAAGWPIWPLLAVSIFGLAILIERSWYLRKKRVLPAEVLQEAFKIAAQVNQSLGGRQLDPQLATLINSIGNSSPVGSLLACALAEKLAGAPANHALEELQATAEAVWLKLDRYLGALATIATVAPLLGLFGTVVGMIEIFGSQGSAVGNPLQLAHGISVALYNTAFGLLIAIPALAAWRLLRSMADQRQRECEEFTRQLFKKLYPNASDE
jgi:biopolymer transport protein ExbB